MTTYQKLSQVDLAEREAEELLDYYHLAEHPFSLSPDPRFLYHTEKHMTAFRRCRSNIVRKQGLSVVTGDVGTGKSTVARRLHLDFTEAEASEHYECRFIKNTANWNTSFKLILDLSKEFGCQSRRSETAQWAEFEMHVQKIFLGGKTVVLLVDEAQSIPSKVLIRIREILNFEADDSKFVQFVLFGTQQLRKTLFDPALHPLNNRIAGGIAHLGALGLEECTEAIKFRLMVAGRSKPLFADDCYPLIHEASGGVLRDIVNICAQSLEISFEDQETLISPETVAIAITAGRSGVLRS